MSDVVSKIYTQFENEIRRILGEIRGEFECDWWRFGDVHYDIEHYI